MKPENLTKNLHPGLFVDASYAFGRNSESVVWFKYNPEDGIELTITKDDGKTEKFRSWLDLDEIDRAISALQLMRKLEQSRVRQRPLKDTDRARLSDIFKDIGAFMNQIIRDEGANEESITGLEDCVSEAVAVLEE